jgi:hypothetical protein
MICRTTASPVQLISHVAARPPAGQNGPVAQLGARVNGIHEVTGSNPVWSTKPSFPVWILRTQLKASAGGRFQVNLTSTDNDNDPFNNPTSRS